METEHIPCTAIEPSCSNSLSSRGRDRKREKPHHPRFTPHLDHIYKSLKTPLHPLWSRYNTPFQLATRQQHKQQQQQSPPTPPTPPIPNRHRRCQRCVARATKHSLPVLVSAQVLVSASQLPRPFESTADSINLLDPLATTDNKTTRLSNKG